MNKPSERIVVFVTPAQKLAIASTADRLGISVSELMRRAVLNFGATSEQVKAASIVDRLNAPREPDALNAALQRVAAASKRNHARGNAVDPLAALRRQSAAQRDAQSSISGTQNDAAASESVPMQQPDEHGILPTSAGVDASDDSDSIEPIDEDAVARVTAAWRNHAGRETGDADDRHDASTVTPPSPSAAPVPSSLLNARRTKPSAADESEDDPGADPTAEGGHFA